MRLRRLLAGVVLGSVAAVLWQRRAQTRDRVDVYFEDGSMISLADGSTILPVARRILETAR